VDPTGCLRLLCPRPYQVRELMPLTFPATTLCEIRHYQRSTELIIPNLSFARLVCKITHKIGAEFGVEFHFQALAMEVLQEAAEAYLVNDFGSQHTSRNSWAHFPP
jgi:histone H3/H4